MAAEPPGMTDRLLDAMAGSAARRYGAERVSELAHALQCAELAREAGADEGLTLACLLHDVGRFAVDQALIFDRVGGGRAGGRGHHSARGHHEVGADLIAPYVPERVTWLVRMHADAKRYLCSTEPGYHATLSPASQHTMTLQGGLMRPEEITRHAAHPWLGDALRLRRWDDLAKVVGKATAPLAAWEPLLRSYFR
jgi:gamma-butyrobetaine dioxygenase